MVFIQAIVVQMNALQNIGDDTQSTWCYSVLPMLNTSKARTGTIGIKSAAGVLRAAIWQAAQTAKAVLPDQNSHGRRQESLNPGKVVCSSCTQEHEDAAAYCGWHFWPKALKKFPGVHSHFEVTLL